MGLAASLAGTMLGGPGASLVDAGAAESAPRGLTEALMGSGAGVMVLGLGCGVAVSTLRGLADNFSDPWLMLPASPV